MFFINKITSWRHREDGDIRVDLQPLGYKTTVFQFKVNALNTMHSNAQVQKIAAENEMRAIFRLSDAGYL